MTAVVDGRRCSTLHRHEAHTWAWTDEPNREAGLARCDGVGYLERLAVRVARVMAAESDRLAAVGTPNAIEQGIGVAHAMNVVLQAIIRDPAPAAGVVDVQHDLGERNVAVQVHGPAVDIPVPETAPPAPCWAGTAHGPHVSFGAVDTGAGVAIVQRDCPGYVARAVRVIPDGAGEGPVAIRHDLGAKQVIVQVITPDNQELWPPASCPPVDRDTIEVSAPGVDLSGHRVVVLA